MTLNPSAEVFVPSSRTLRSLGNSKPQKNEALLSSMNYNYPPPQLESIYLDTSHLIAAAEEEEEERLTHLPETARRDIDYSNFDVNFFFFDLTSADSDDFENYLSDRAEYLLGYAGTSQTHAEEVVENILGWSFNLMRKSWSYHKRPMILAAKMSEMDSVFLQMMLYKVEQLLTFIRNHLDWRSHDDVHYYCVLLAVMLSELHIGSCIAPPVTSNGFVNDLFLVFCELLESSATLRTAIDALQVCVEQFLSMASNEQINLLHCMLRKCRPSNGLRDERLEPLFIALQNRTRFYCVKLHAVPIAQMNDEETQDFELFLREKQANAPRRRN